MMRDHLNRMLLAAQMAGDMRAGTRLGIISAWDSSMYSAKVKIQPGDIETGWLPVLSPWVGNGWGLFAPPSVGDLVEVQFQDDDIDAGFVCQRFYNDVDRPLAVAPGEFWLVHQSGSALKFKTDGSVELIAAGNLNATIGGNANLTVAGNLTTNVSGSITETAPSITLNGAITLNGPVVQGKGSGGGDMQLQGPLNVVGDVTAGNISLKNHTHTDPQGGQTGTPL